MVDNPGWIRRAVRRFGDVYRGQSRQAKPSVEIPAKYRVAAPERVGDEEKVNPGQGEVKQQPE